MARRDSVPDRIKGVAASQGIRFLLHFTIVDNLPNIVEHGILSREILSTADFDAYVGAVTAWMTIIKWFPYPFQRSARHFHQKEERLPRSRMGRARSRSKNPMDTGLRFPLPQCGDK
ncbi:hypothetical protein [Mesorhizobium ventifaucium]|uniref:hypothetical protein n=1 Tax=Mesorhizobium ventifaucium TaxID=666020 RepID=UPI0020A80C52|nr:hypothetical protein [Mesorhizobium ventifaucium]